MIRLASVLPAVRHGSLDAVLVQDDVQVAQVQVYDPQVLQDVLQVAYVALDVVVGVGYGASFLLRHPTVTHFRFLLLQWHTPAHHLWLAHRWNGSTTLSFVSHDKLLAMINFWGIAYIIPRMPCTCNTNKCISTCITTRQIAKKGV